MKAEDLKIVLDDIVERIAAIEKQIKMLPQTPLVSLQKEEKIASQQDQEASIQEFQTKWMPIFMNAAKWLTDHSEGKKRFADTIINTPFGHFIFKEYK